jgi:co-chaperonin GroES (HSP10)
MIDIVPTGHHVLVEVQKVEKKTAGGIIIPDDRVERDQCSANKGKVIALGPNAFRDFGGNPWCKIGDTVIFPKYSGLEYKSESKEDETLYRILNDEDIKSVLCQ